METLRDKEECWELKKGVLSSIMERGSGIGSVRTQQDIMLVDQMVK